MAARLKKCAICNEYIQPEEKSLPYKNRWVHERCFQVQMRTLKKDKDDQLKEASKGKKTRNVKPKVELKEAMSEEEYAEKKAYYQYLRDLLHDELSAKVYAISEQYISRYNFTFKGMYQTLAYLHEIIEKELIGDIVGLIPYYYDQAKEYYESVDKIQEANKDIDIDKMYKEKVIVIQPRKRITKQLDIENIGREEAHEN